VIWPSPWQLNLTKDTPLCISACLLPHDDAAVTVQFEIEEFMKDFGLTGTPCAGASVPSLGYNGIVPGPLITRPQCACCTFACLRCCMQLASHGMCTSVHVLPFHPPGSLRLLWV
jgi:hypothetical protein